MIGRSAVARARTWDHLVNSEVLYHLSYDGPLLHFLVEGVA